MPLASAASSTAVRHTLLVGLDDGDRVGWGEAAPYPGATPDTVETARMELQRTAGEIRDGVLPGTLTVTARAAVDQARRDLAARRAGSPLWAELGGSAAPVTGSLVVGLGGQPEATVASVAEAAHRGYRAVKIKIAPGHDVAVVAAVRDAHPDILVGVDGNQSYDDPGDPVFPRLASLGAAYVEQPFPASDLESHRRLRSAAGLAVCLDESATDLDAIRHSLALDAADGFVLKPGRLGITDAVTAAAEIDAAGGWWKASGLVETGVGRAHTLALATLGGRHHDLAADDDLLESSPTRPRLVLVDGALTPAPGPGIGVTPASDLAVEVVGG